MKLRLSNLLLCFALFDSIHPPSAQASMYPLHEWHELSILLSLDRPLWSPNPNLPRRSPFLYPSPSPSATQVSPAKEEQKPWWEPMKAPFFLFIAMAGSLALTTLASKLQQVEQETRNKILNIELRNPKPLESNEKRNSIIILGLGGSGKTTLIQRLAKDAKANPDIPTAQFESYSWFEKANVQDPLHTYYAADHKGQNSGSLIAGLINEQKKPYSPMTWGAINSLIFVVDVAKAFDKNAQSEAEYQEEVRNTWKNRIQENMMQWSPTALDLIFGFTTKPTSDPSINSLKYVCLFINKVDLLPGNEKEISKLYQELTKRIGDRCSGLRFEVIHGSIFTGEGLPKLEASLKVNSWSK
jgi:hypothetical protein